MSKVKTPEQIERDKARNAAIRDAKNAIRSFFTDPLFLGLPAKIQDALKTLAPVARQATSTAMNEIKALFKDKKVLSEMDIFKALKIGPNEMKAKVNHGLKVSAPEDRLWIAYDDKECTWTLVATGQAMPKGFPVVQLIPSIAERVGKPAFATMTVNQMIDAEKSEPVQEKAQEEVSKG